LLRALLEGVAAGGARLAGYLGRPFEYKLARALRSHRYQPFAEPDPPRAPLTRAALLARAARARGARAADGATNGARAAAAAPPPPTLRPSRGFAYATLLYSDADGGYAAGVLALLQSLRDVGARADIDRVVLCGHGVAARTRAALVALGARVVDVDTDADADAGAAGGGGEATGGGEAGAGAARLGLGQWLKLALWRLVEYDTVLYLDADTLALRNLDQV
jgi:hypothetical protein